MVGMMQQTSRILWLVMYCKCSLLELVASPNDLPKLFALTFARMPFANTAGINYFLLLFQACMRDMGIPEDDINGEPFILYKLLCLNLLIYIQP